MSARLPAHALDEVALKWRALAERRRTHFVELYHSGRWKHYWTEEQFLNLTREVVRACERWAEIAPRPADQARAEERRRERAQLAPAGSAAATPRRTAA